MRIAALVGVVAGCGSGGKFPLERYAVGTYIGGASILGKDDCTYEGGPSVFMPSGTTTTPSSTPAPGPRFISGPGRIVIHCPNTELEMEAVEPTGATIEGPSTIQRGNHDRFSAHLVAGTGELQGNGAIEWTLGTDCAGVATFATVLGAQDTGGKDRTRTLEPTHAGNCTVIATITTGSALYASFQPKAFQADKLVTIQ